MVEQENTYNEEEVSCLSFFINSRFCEDEDPEIKRRLPINPDTEELFGSMGDGYILMKLLNLIEKDTIDMRTIAKYRSNMSTMAVKKNVLHVLTAVKGQIDLSGIDDT
jgi:hypothetical protein